MPHYLSDTGGGVDLLDRNADAAALADVITARSAAPPLAIGVFGQWGEGKSMFLEILQRQVQERVRSAGLDDPVSYGAVRQVRFNAWHYAETDLWASLVAELFAQMADDPLADMGKEQRRQSRLASELIDARGVRERLDAAQARLARLQSELEGGLGGWQALSSQTQAALQEVAGDRAEQLFREAARTRLSVRTSARAVRQVIRGIPRWYWLLAGICTAALVALLVWGSGLYHELASVPFVLAVGSLMAGFTKAWTASRPARERAKAAWGQVRQVREAQVRRLQTARDVAAGEVKELQALLQNQTAAGQLAGLVQDRVDAGTYRQRLGMMTQIRQDFERMAKLLIASPNQPSAAPQVDAAGDELPSIDRIVLYIDDLDRCPPTRVVQVLEAVHLLLAVRLFVVVVAVDPRWLLRSLTAHYRAMFAATEPTSTGLPLSATVTRDNGDDGWASTPEQYLEKIFQIVLTLPPMQDVGYGRMLEDLVGVRADADAQAVAPGPEQTFRMAVPEPAHGSTTPAQVSTLADKTRPPDRARTVDRVDPMALTPDEHNLLLLLGPPLVVSPRAVKRLANSYGLLAALRADAAIRNGVPRPDLESILDNATGSKYVPYRAGMVLLAVVIGFPNLGPGLFPHLYHQAAHEPEVTWCSYVDTLRPCETGGWANAVEDDMTEARATEWQALTDALTIVHQRAEEIGLPLPAPLSAWKTWVIPVGRLSFPTGSVVTALQRWHPLAH